MKTSVAIGAAIVISTVVGCFAYNFGFKRGADCTAYYGDIDSGATSRPPAIHPTKVKREAGRSLNMAIDTKMNINAVEEFKKRLSEAIDNDQELYDALPGDGQDDYIIGLILGLIKTTK